MLLEWGCKAHLRTALSTPDGELKAEGDLTFRSALPLAGLLEELWRRPIKMVGHTDNETALITIRKGYSRKLSYLKKYHKLSISSLHEVWCAARRATI